MPPPNDRVQHREADAVDLEALAGAPGMPRQMLLRHATEKAGVAAVGDQRARLHDQPGRDPREHRRQAAQVIRMRMGHHDESERSRAVTLEKRRNHPPSRIGSPVCRSGIHEDPPTAGRAEYGRVPLPDVQKM